MSEIIYPPINPGEILLEEFMKPLGLTEKNLSEALGVDVERISRIVTGKSKITADIALRLARYFGTTPQLWKQWSNGLGQLSVTFWCKLLVHAAAL